MFSFPPRSRTSRTIDTADGSSLGSLLGDDRETTGERSAAARGGWHSSSFELMDGLEVIEDVDLDAVPADWPMFPSDAGQPRR
jgi:hypothetical protein